MRTALKEILLVIARRFVMFASKLEKDGFVYRVRTDRPRKKE